jgi:transposase, IS30 family
MTPGYTHLGAAERATLMVRLAAGEKPAAIARELGRSRSTISRELARNQALPDRDTGKCENHYDASRAQARAERLAHQLGPRKLDPEQPLFSFVRDQLAREWSPEQIAGVLKHLYPGDATRRVCHETIYSAIYVLPRGELKSELIGNLRRTHRKRWRRSRGVDRRGRIPDMISLHQRPPEVAGRLVPGHWEGDLIKGKGNKSCVGTLVERTSRLVILARMEDASAGAALTGFSTALERIDANLRKTLTYDQGREMARHKELAARCKVDVYFADPHSPWQRGSNENANGLLRQYLPKGTDLSGLSQDDLDDIALKVNTRPRKMHDFHSPMVVYHRLMQVQMKSS